MSVISREKAEQTAEKLCKKHKEKSDQATCDFFKFLIECYNKSIPRHILNSYKKDNGYFKMTSSIYVHGAGWGQHGYREFYLPNKQYVISNQAGSYNGCKFKPDPKMNDAIVKAKQDCESVENKYKELLKETVTALLNLKTIKRITEQFPEAIACFPAQVYPVPVVLNLEKLRAEFKPVKKAS